MYENEMSRVGGSATVSMETKQINELERLLEEYRGLVSIVDTTPKVNEEIVTKLNQEKEQLTKEVAELNQTIKHLKAQSEIAESKGIAFDVRILHFTNNPLDNVRRQTLEQLSQLEKENESLRERVRLMEADQTRNPTLLVGDHFEQGCIPERLRDLEEKLKSSEMKNERVEEVFRKYCSEFRRGIFELFGYQVDNDECGNFKLTSVFSKSRTDYLSFKYVGDGLMVMDSAYLHTIYDLVQLHINNQKFIPIFLSALTVELYPCQSINSSAYPSVLFTPS
ncbi:mitotic spindle assembly checkpoint protein MAD1-like [Daphnia carinata]|uniref:mitotic spindle assembly checkpoint protein MAD1-like n=1 Tax=Daphnia carinata TaxID=120202 RepID=UPI00257C4D33|nr:mitotic spindle assembly checkpoint protein MAD1-like [Daphnia carinata]